VDGNCFKTLGGRNPTIFIPYHNGYSEDAIQMMTARNLLIVLAIPSLFLIINQNIFGQAEADNSLKRMQAIRVNRSSPIVDGKLDDEVWKKAVFVSDFVQVEPNQGALPTEKTEVAIIYDDEAIYVGARMYSKDPEAIRMLLGRRDQHGDTEQFAISLDTYHDRRTAYGFGVKISGVRYDRYYPEDEEENQDYSFDPVWDAETSVGADYWTAEMRIPFSQLRFNNEEKQIWGVNLNRWIPSRNEDDYWIVIPKDSTGWASRFGTLEGIEGIKPSRRLELLPYVAGDGNFSSNHAAGDPFNDGSDVSMRIGADLKMGLGPNLTLDATINPDFGQVEADPAIVNLSAYETYFDEKRPFFIEGSQLLSDNNFFYSRRIGAPPHGFLEGDFTNIPNSSTILGAAKLSGRLNSGLSIAALSAVTEREYGHYYNIPDSSYASKEVEPATFYGVTKLQQEFGKNHSTVGFFLSGVRRDISTGEPLSSVLRRQAITGYSDFDFRLHGGDYVLSGLFGFSHLEGDKAVMLRTQQSSVHYFQRPDANHVSVDSNRTSLSGYGASLSFEKNSGRHWLYSAEVLAESPGLDLNDIGILQAADDIECSGGLTYRENNPGSIFHQYRVSVYSGTGWNFGGVRQYSYLEFDPSVTWKNYWTSYIGAGLNLRSMKDDLTRGGPLMGSPLGGWFNIGIGNNSAATTKYNTYYGYEWNEFGGIYHNFGFYVTTRLGDGLEFAIEPSYLYGNSARQYVKTIDNGPESTFGKRYIFSWLERSEISSRFRINYFFGPNLSLEIYAEPFASSGRYFKFGELPAPRSRELRTYGTDGTTITKGPDGNYEVVDGEQKFSIPNRDFDYLSFRSNVVLRWEFRPGSTLFLVWQQNREGEDDPGRLVRGKSLWESLQAKGEDFIAIKISYWIPVS